MMNTEELEVVECEVSVKLYKRFKLLVPKGLSKNKLEDLIDSNLDSRHMTYNGVYSESPLKLEEIYERTDKDSDNYNYCLR